MFLSNSVNSTTALEGQFCTDNNICFITRVEVQSESAVHDETSVRGVDNRLEV